MLCDDIVNTCITIIWCTHVHISLYTLLVSIASYIIYPLIFAEQVHVWCERYKEATLIYSVVDLDDTMRV